MDCPPSLLRTQCENGRVEGFDTTVRLITRRAYGFHSADAGPIDLKLPHE